MKQERVPVVDKNNVPLMPTRPSKARRLVRDGKAVGLFNQLGVYYIQLTFEPENRKTQLIAAGLDPGKKYAAVGVQSSRFTLFTAHLFLPFETVKKRMEQRRMMRRSRRGRRIDRSIPFKFRAHRQCRFNNRRQKKVVPSVKSNRLWEIRVISELAKIYPITKIVFEYVKAKTKKRCSFSPVQVGQKWAIKQLSKIAPVTTKFGWQTAKLREHFGLPKQKHSKGDAVPETHSLDSLVLASSVFKDYLPFENSQGRGHCWQGRVRITPCPFFVIRRPPISRRQLHLLVPAKGGQRRKYGGSTTPFDIRKGDLVRYKDKLGYCSGYTGKSISVSDVNWKRLGKYVANKVKLVKRSTNLICKNIIGGARFLYG
ncbi:MAG TPA: RRXRR domain-containing protein [Coleofasciculaceae cyanobacterium]|jgi:hypothetical protein